MAFMRHLQPGPQSRHLPQAHIHTPALTSVRAQNAPTHSAQLQPMEPETTALAYSRRALLAGMAAVLPVSMLMRPTPVSAAPGAPPVSGPISVQIQPQQTPDQGTYDINDPDLRDAVGLLQEGLNASDVQAEEAKFSELISKYDGLDKPWAPDVLGRAYSNRGNARIRQGRFKEAEADYNRAIKLCPWAPDPVLNRGVVLEAQGRFEEAAGDYRSVLAVSPQDPAAWNNLGNASAGMGRWDQAVQYYTQASQLAPEFSFAAANRALALYQSGSQEPAIREMRTLLRRYPFFTDVRAALTAALWRAGLEEQAETNWQRVIGEDPRYRDRTWVATNRRWPPLLVEGLSAFLDLQSSKLVTAA